MATNLMNILGMLGGQQDPEEDSEAVRLLTGSYPRSWYHKPLEFKKEDQYSFGQLPYPNLEAEIGERLEDTKWQHEMGRATQSPGEGRGAPTFKGATLAILEKMDLAGRGGPKGPKPISFDLRPGMVEREIRSGLRDIPIIRELPNLADQLSRSDAFGPPRDRPYIGGIPVKTVPPHNAPIDFDFEDLQEMLGEGQEISLDMGPAKDPKEDKGQITEKPGDPILDKEDQASIDPFYQKITDYAKEHGITKEEAFKRLAQEELGAGSDDLDEFMTDITQRLTEALDRKPGWPEFLMAFALTLQGQDGVSYLRSLNSQYLGRSRILGNLLGEARSEKSRRDAMGVSASQAQAKQWDDATGNYHTRMQKYYGEKQSQARSRISDLREVSKANPIDTPLDSKAIKELALQRDYWIEMEGAMSAMSAGGKWASEEKVRAGVLKKYPKYKELFKKK